MKAAEAALVNANIRADDVDLIVVATTTPENTFPLHGRAVAGTSGLTRGFASDVQAVCSGIVYALTMADNFCGLTAKTALVIGAETLSRLVDRNDHGTCVLSEMALPPW